MCKELEAELGLGKEAAEVLVNHLKDMGASTGTIPVTTEDGEFEVVVRLKAIDYNLVSEHDGKWHLHDTDGNKVRLLTDKECADYIWGKDSKPKQGMYDETPLIRIGNITIRENQNPVDDCVWMEDNGVNGGKNMDSGSFLKSSLELVLKAFYDKNF